MEALAALEARAVPVTAVMGTILERIVYKALVDKGIPFDFQSSLVGGRAGYQFGRQTADFVFWQQHLVVEVQGEYWHAKGEQHWRDIVRELVLSGEGWTTLYLEQDVVFNQFLLNEWLDRNVVYGAIGAIAFTFPQGIEV